jgi:hypothetical protein
MEAWRLKIESCRVYRTVVADSHHLDEEQDVDPEPQGTEKLDLIHDPHLSDADPQP